MWSWSSAVAWPVSVGPGLTQVTVMPLSAWWSASEGGVWGGRDGVGGLVGEGAPPGETLAQSRPTAGTATPGHLGIVRCPAGGEHRHSVGEQPLRDGEADAGATRDARDERDAAIGG